MVILTCTRHKTFPEPHASFEKGKRSFTIPSGNSQIQQLIYNCFFLSEIALMAKPEKTCSPHENYLSWIRESMSSSMNTEIVFWKP